MSDSIIANKTYDFANRIVKLEKYLRKEKHESIMSKQIFRSGTSIGANVAEAKYAQSVADFISKHQISLKEANETRFWLRLLHDNDYLDDKMFSSLMSDLTEILSMLVSIIKNMKAKSKTPESLQSQGDE